MMKVLQISKGWLYCFLCMLSLDAYAGNLADISTFNVSISGARQFGLAKTDYHVWLRLADDEWAKRQSADIQVIADLMHGGYCCNQMFWVR